jgi:hypothetical protein
VDHQSCRYREDVGARLGGFARPFGSHTRTDVTNR